MIRRAPALVRSEAGAAAPVEALRGCRPAGRRRSTALVRPSRSGQRSLIARRVPLLRRRGDPPLRGQGARSAPAPRPVPDHAVRPGGGEAPGAGQGRGEPVWDVCASEREVVAPRAAPHPGRRPREISTARSRFCIPTSASWPASGRRTSVSRPRPDRSWEFPLDWGYRVAGRGPRGVLRAQTALGLDRPPGPAQPVLAAGDGAAFPRLRPAPRLLEGMA